MRRTALTAVILGLATLTLPALTQPALADPVGLVQRVENNVYGTEPQSSPQPKYKSDGIVFNELIETKRKSAVEIGFIDGTKLTIGAEASVQIDDFAFDDVTSSGKAAISLGGGAFRWVTGLMPPDGVSIETPTATIAIRGTNLKLRVRANGQTDVALEQGALHIVAKGNGATADLEAGQSARITAAGIEIIDQVISVADAFVDDGWYRAIDQERKGQSDRQSNESEHSQQ